MARRLALTLLVILAASPAAAAQPWARKMFNTTSHDFGVVARGSKAEFAFELENIYEEDVHIASVRSSCGCATPKISKRTLKTWEKGSINVIYNTRSFLGARSATLTVTIDRPFFAEVQLNVSGYIRSDIVFDPGSVNLGEMEPEEGGQTAVRVTYAGRSDWRILDVRSANHHFEVELQEAERGRGRVSYRMIVRLKPSAPAGYFQDQLTIVTDDPTRRTIPLLVEGRVKSALTVSPPTLFLGVLRPGESVTKQIVVQAKQSFKVLEVTCDDEGFQFQPPTQSKKLHLIPVTFTAGEHAGEVVETVQIETDLGSGTTASCVATAQVKPPEATQ